MNRPSLPSSLLRAAAPLALLSALFLSSGCGGNAACVFVPGGCDDGGTSLSTDPAGSPFTGMVIDDDLPMIVSVLPEGPLRAPTTPIVVVFSESMQAESLVGAFELVTATGGIGGAVVPLGGQLVAEGRVFVAFPPMELAPNDYQVHAAGIPLDVTGQAVEVDAGDPTALPGESLGEMLASFSVIDDPDDVPQLLYHHPAVDAVGVGESGDLVLVFDRPMDAMTVDDASVAVVEDGGSPHPGFAIGPLEIGPSGSGLTDERVFVAEMPGFMNGVTMSVTLSPAGEPILEQDASGDALVQTSFSFQTASVAMPGSVTILSDPSDAIGSSNLVEGGANELRVQVGLEGGTVGDFVDVYLFGENAAMERRIAFRGTFEVTAEVMDPTNPVLGLAAFPIAIAPGDYRFADGELDIAFRLRRGSATSTLRVYDSEPLTITIEEGVLLDTVGPEVNELLPPGGTTAIVRSDARDLVLAGAATENVRAVEVTAGGMSNMLLPGEPAAAVGAVSARFLAAPVPLGLVPGGSVPFTMVAYDAALNPSDPISGTFEQKGVVRAGASGPGNVDVEVYDEETFAPLSGAMVYVHADMGDGVNYPLVSSGPTDATGRVTLAFDAGAAATIVTAELSTYDLFTIHGLQNTAVSIPLRTSTTMPALAAGSVTSTDPAASITIADGSRAISDTRFLRSGDRAVPTAACMSNIPLVCAFGPESIRASALGAQAFFAWDPTETAVDLDSAQRFLTAFALRIPNEGAASQVTATSQINVESRLADGAPDELPGLFPSANFDASLTNGIDLGNLEGDPLGEDGDLVTPLPARPRVTVETEVPGLAGALAVGTGVQVDLGGGMWEVRPVHPGIFERAGFLGSTDAAADRLRVRFELRDTAGNITSRRPTGAELPGVFGLQDVTQLAAPSSPVTFPFDVELTNSIPDPETGFYRVVLDDGSRRWTLWRVDTAGAGNVRVRVPALGAAPLSAGALNVGIESFQAPGADPTSFLWADLVNRHDRYTRTEEQAITLQ